VGQVGRRELHFQEMRQEDQQMTGELVLLAMPHVLDLLGEMPQVQRVHGAFPQQCRLLLGPGVEILVVQRGLGAH
jgi:hypothetical protein